ncbi:maleylacetate reductase [Allokutzneria multivorans]|uniref:Maleylacetate reductase n=1 Tax=Allokutzneria multivorans TaxID=1142134 RepID=A0ABP7SEQ9_9PSEU
MRFPYPEFVHSLESPRVVFGFGSARLGPLAEELDRLEFTRVLFLAAPEHAEIAQRLADRVVGVFTEARMHVPVDVVDDVVELATERGVQACVAVGGGSTIGLAKALALRAGLPYIAVPTTYAGSEMTTIWGLTDSGLKRTGRDPIVAPRTVVYDPELTLSLPTPMSVTSGINAIAHAVEALYAPDGTPIVALLAEESIRALVRSLPVIAAKPTDHGARGDALYGAWLAGICLNATTMGLHHKLCHSLGGTLDLPHASTHTVVLPHVLAFNAQHGPNAVRAMASALQVEERDAPRALQAFATRLGAPISLAELGARRDGLSEVVEQAVNVPYSNPRPVDAADLMALLNAAYDGRVIGR